MGKCQENVHKETSTWQHSRDPSGLAKWLMYHGGHVRQELLATSVAWEVKAECHTAQSCMETQGCICYKQGDRSPWYSWNRYVHIPNGHNLSKEGKTGHPTAGPCATACVLNWGMS